MLSRMQKSHYDDRMKVEAIWLSMTVTGFLLIGLRGFLLQPWISLLKRYPYRGHEFTGTKCADEKVYCGQLWRKMDVLGADTSGLYLYGRMLGGWNEVLVPWSDFTKVADSTQSGKGWTRLHVGARHPLILKLRSSAFDKLRVNMHKT